MRHLLGIEDLSKDELLFLLNNSKEMATIADRDIKKVPALRGKTIINFFFEASTRTRSSFEIAAKRLSADVINFSASTSSVSKGETLLDTALNLESMAPDILVVRHQSSGAPHFLARHLKNARIVNAGDGTHEHPTQALLDCATLEGAFAQRKRTIEGGLTVAIVGDVLHSRVARSNVFAHLLLGNQVRLIGPATLVPEQMKAALGVRNPGASVEVFESLEQGLRDADVVMCLRMQRERQQGFFVASMDEYSARYCVTEKLLARAAPNSVVLHPGPVNRGIEISSEVVDGPRSLVQQQVHFGVAVRMAVLHALLAGDEISNVARST